MATMTIDETMQRIEGTPKDSPIAVFRSRVKDQIKSVFASTIVTQRLIAVGHPDFVGVFDGTMEQGRVRGRLSKALGVVNPFA